MLTIAPFCVAAPLSAHSELLQVYVDEGRPRSEFIVDVILLRWGYWAGRLSFPRLSWTLAWSQNVPTTLQLTLSSLGVCVPLSFTPTRLVCFRGELSAMKKGGSAITVVLRPLFHLTSAIRLLAHLFLLQAMRGHTLHRSARRQRLHMAASSGPVGLS